MSSLQTPLNPAGRLRAAWKPTLGSYRINTTISIVPHLPPLTGTSDHLIEESLLSTGEQYYFLCQGIPESKVFGFSFTDPWPSGRISRHATPHPIPIGYTVTDTFHVGGNHCSQVILVKPLYHPSHRGSQALPEVLVAKIFDPKLYTLDNCLAADPMRWSQYIYARESYAYRQLQGLREVPSFYGTFTATLDDDDGKRVVCLVLTKYIQGTVISDLPMVPDWVFVSMMAADIRMLRRGVFYTNFTTMHYLVEGNRLVVIDFEAVYSNVPDGLVQDEEMMLDRWYDAFMVNEMCAMVEDKSSLEYIDRGRVSKDWLKRSLMIAMEEVGVEYRTEEE